jgi:hypothetical protein
MRKEHKFFKRKLNNDLTELSDFLRYCYSLIESASLRGVNPKGQDDKYFLDSNSATTIKWREYNAFQFYHPGIYDLFAAVSDMTKEACQYYGIDFHKQKYMVQGWFNICRKGVGKLNWHDHGPPYAPYFHGYYAVNAEPSTTHYRLYNDPNQVKDNVNENNVAILSEMGHPHAMGDWGWEGDRITLAYDVVPTEFLVINEHGDHTQQHWIPMI